MSTFPRKLGMQVEYGDNVVLYDDDNLVRANLSAALVDFDRVASEPFAAELVRRWNARGELAAALESGAAKNAALESLFLTASIALGQLDKDALGLNALATSLRIARRALGRGVDGGGA